MNRIKITMFKDFTITYNNQEIIVNKFTSRKICGLLQLIIFNKKGISKEELIDELWQNATNPLNSLKHSIFRLRLTLAELDCFQGVKLISTIKNGYVFAPDLIVESDYARMEECNDKIHSKDTSKSDRIYYAEKILELYKGALFVNDLADWSTKARIYYSDIYEKAFTIVCDEYLGSNRENELIPIILQATKVDKFYDGAYEYYMKVLIKMKEFSKVAQLYQYVKDLYERELRQFPSKYLKDLYQSTPNIKEDVINLEELNRNLTSYKEKSTALCCDFDTFQYIYKFCLNNSIREHKDAFLLILSLNSKEEQKKHEYAMLKLKKVLSSCLRGGDVFTKINQTQIIVLLSCKTIENGYAIIQRITSKFYKLSNKEKYRIHYFISSVMEFHEDISQI